MKLISVFIAIMYSFMFNDDTSMLYLGGLGEPQINEKKLHSIITVYY